MRKSILVPKPMRNTKRSVELPLVEPVYSTYHYQGAATAILASNPSLCNREMNEILQLFCTRKFLNGFTTPEISIAESSFDASPYFDKKKYSMQFLAGHVHFVIRKLLDAGYYVYFSGIDDYYVEGKSHYGKRHFKHDGCICGYDLESKTYSIYAYDQNWIYQKFKTPMKAFENGRKAEFKAGVYGTVWGIKPKAEKLVFSPSTALESIEKYLDSDIGKYPEDGEGLVFGIVVHEYIAKYVDLLFDGTVPYERMDSRVFRMIWEHKKAMLERIKCIEDALSLDHAISDAYREVVKDADHCRMLYAAHHMKQRNTVLPVIRKKLLVLKEREAALLKALLQKTKGENTK